MDATASSSSAGRRLPEIDWAAEGIETELGWSLHAVYQGFSRLASDAVVVVPGGARGYQVLVAITTEDPSSQLALAHRLGIDKTAIVYVIDALEGGGLVERRADPADRRIRQVIPTAAGRALLTGARRALREAESRLLADLSGDDQRQLRQLLARVALGAGDLESCTTTTAATVEQPIAAPHRSAGRRATSAAESRNHR